ncbi:chromosomal replication initiator DnaA [Aliiroseovarius subalbicans]|uniref:chromosomal replication initiator DnaA n=1 Tax=Aliiroseovarius subalbicans TaxID=2925840 RepID=UPI001F58D437|nr:chromosomal replication initiator DnaA [Aliiroseovarius subalbicans]MCI2400778.1 chromosomal replication initiator DnaA [Aliiroseovarius subalbicans]
MPRQLTFDLPARPAQGRGDFFVSPSNAAAMGAIETWQDWPNRKLVVAGDEGTGKTHLTHVWAGLSGAVVMPATALDSTDIAALAGRSVAVEGADVIAGDRAREEALFHLHNLVLAEGGALLITARKAPARWGLSLPDLASRMEATTLARLDPPDDMLLSVVLVKLFDDRQITVTPTLITYLVPRMTRSLSAAAELVEELDRAALAENRAVTRSLAAHVLEKFEAGEA